MGIENREVKKEAKKSKASPVTNITDPDKLFRADLEWLLSYFGEVDPLSVPSDRSRLAIAIIHNYKNHVERTKPERFDAHNLF